MILILQKIATAERHVRLYYYTAGTICNNTNIVFKSLIVIGNYIHNMFIFFYSLSGLAGDSSRFFIFWISPLFILILIFIGDYNL